MTLDMIDMAKDLIQKGNALNDPELVAMGMSMLEKYQEHDDVPDYAIVTTKESVVHYLCTNCNHTMDYDKSGRKKCPKCKKHTLILNEVSVMEVKPSEEGINKLNKILSSNNLKSHRATADDFSTQIRQPKSSRIRYDDQGNPVGMYTRTEQIEGVTNVWTDEDKEEGQDEQNEILKKLTKVSPRTRPPVKFKKMTCEVCHNTFDIHPIHVGGRAQFVCDRCIRRRTRI